METQDYQYELTHPNPNSKNALFLHILFQKKIKHSFILLVAEVAKVLQINLDSELSLLQNLDANKKFNLIVYYKYYKLLNLMKSNNVVECKKLLDPLCSDLSNKAYTDKIKICELNNFDWETEFQLEALADKGGGNFVKLPATRFTHCQQNVNKALQLIETYCPNMYAEICDHVTLLRLIGRGETRFIAGSSLKYFGAISIVDPGDDIDALFYFFDIITHETSHLHLHLLMSLDPMVTNRNELYYSPARNTSRPLEGIFHAHFVFYRLLYLYKNAAAHFTEKNNTKIRLDESELNKSIIELPWKYQERWQAYKYKFYQGEAIIKQGAKLTTAGNALLDNMSNNVASWD